MDSSTRGHESAACHALTYAQDEFELLGRTWAVDYHLLTPRRMALEEKLT
jgi:hypothetical protein